LTRDRRDSLRIEFESLQAQIELPSVCLETDLLDLSARGGALDAPREFAIPSDNKAILRLAEGVTVVTSVVPVHTRHMNDRSRIGVRFTGMGPRETGLLARFLGKRFMERSLDLSRLLENGALSVGGFRRDLVQRVLQLNAITRGQRLRIYSDNLLLPLTLVASDFTVEAARQLVTAEVVNGSSESLTIGDEYSLTFDGAGGVYVFQSAIWRKEPKRIWLTLPPYVKATGFRGSLRTALQPGQEIRFAFGHPRLSGLHLEKQILDVSATGLSFLFDPFQDTLFPGELLQGVLLGVSERPIPVKAVIRSMRDRSPDGSLSCGLELLNLTGDAAERWTRFVFYASHPNVRLVDRDSVGKAWQALKSSGYVDLVDEGQQNGLEDSFRSVWSTQTANRGLGRFFLVYQEGRPVATAAASLLYPRTWLPHHFGVDESERRRDRSRLYHVARETYSGIMFLLQHMTNMEYFIFYFDAAKSWHDLTFAQFLERFPRKQDYLYDGYKLFRYQPRSDLSQELDLPDGLEIVPGDPKLLRRLSRHQSQNLPKIEFDAFSYSELEIGLERFASSCAAQGYERERRIFFAVERGRPLAALIAETGSAGVNIFGLLDMCWLVFLAPRSAADLHIRRALLKQAVRFYTRRAKPSFLYLGKLDGEPMGLLEKLGFDYETDGLRWLARRSIVPAYVNYIREVMGLAMELDA
jgi:hypothetical protein